MQNAQPHRNAVTVPSRLAHVVLRTSQYKELIAWYETVLGAEIVFSNEALTFLTYDDEHHRVAILHIPGLAPQVEGVCGVHHVAFTYASLAALVSNYERLRAAGIEPVTSINHGPTTSLYYADPDGNQIELQVDNFATVEEASKFFYSPAFATNPIGVDFDPEDLVRRFHAGEDEATIKARPDSGPRDLHSLQLR